MPSAVVGRLKKAGQDLIDGVLKGVHQVHSLDRVARGSGDGRYEGGGVLAGVETVGEGVAIERLGAALAVGN